MDSTVVSVKRAAVGEWTREMVARLESSQNLLHDPFFADTARFWKIDGSGSGDGYVTLHDAVLLPPEDDGAAASLPVGDVDTFDGSSQQRSCIATSYGWTKIEQRVPLEPADVGGRVTFEFCVSSRGDQAAQFYAECSLRAGNENTPLAMHSVASRSSPAMLERGTAWERCRVVLEARASAGKEAEHGGAATLVLWGKDQSFWAGHYGARFTGAGIFLGDGESPMIKAARRRL